MSKKLSTTDTFLNTEMTFKEENGRAVLRRAKDGDIIGSVRIGEGGNAEWGQISGELKNQTDLKTELDDKVPNATLEAVVGQFTQELERVNDRINGKQNELTAGEGITIDHDVISATGTTTVNWGDIDGTLENQKDLQGALDVKAGKDELAYETERATSAETSINNTLDAMQQEITAKQKQLVAGPNITITPGEDHDTISASGEVAPTEWGQIGGDIDNQTDLIETIEETWSVEAEDRQQADTLLDNKITAEAGAREQGDNALGTRMDGLDTDLNVEISARESEDLALDGKIGGVASDLTLETNERKAEDFNIHTELNGKQRKLVAGENITITPGDTEDTISAVGGSAEWGAIEGRIGDQEDLMNLLNSKANTADLSDEILRAQGAEAVITENLNSKSTQSALEAETTARTSADTALGGRIDEAESEIEDVSDALDAEIIERGNADTALSGRITAAEGNITDLQNGKEDSLTFNANYGIGLVNRTPVIEEATEGEITPFLDAYHPITPHNFKTALTAAGGIVLEIEKYTFTSIGNFLNVLRTRTNLGDHVYINRILGNVGLGLETPIECDNISLTRIDDDIFLGVGNVIVQGEDKLDILTKFVMGEGILTVYTTTKRFSPARLSIPIETISNADATLVKWSNVSL